MVEQTIIIGLDALDFNYLDEFEDSVPNITSLRQKGVESPLESTLPPVTGSAWPSMYTGVDPSYHGIHSFFTYKGRYPNDGSIVSLADVKMPAIWNYLTSLNESSIVLNVPVTHPAEKINGVMIPGYLAPEDSPSQPEDVRDRLTEEFGEYRIYPESEMSDTEKSGAEYVDLINSRARSTHWLLDNYDWSMAFIQIQKTDNIFHDFNDKELFRAVYKAADELVGELLETYEECNVIVCSDHGMGPVDGYRIFLNTILEEKGYITPTKNANLPKFSPDETKGDSKNAGEDSETVAKKTQTLLSTSENILRFLGLTPGDLYSAAQKLHVDEYLLKALPEEFLYTSGQGINWNESIAYCRRPSEMGVRINLKGREPNGVVDPDEYEEVRKNLIELLRSLRTPDGNPAFNFVVPYEEYYSGPQTEDACDIVFLPYGMNNKISTNIIGSRFAEIDSYEHKVNGVFIAHGPSFNDNCNLDGLSLIDVAPIIMNAMNFDVPSRMRGEIPPDLLKHEVNKRDYEIALDRSKRSKNEGDEIEQRLEDLGYL